MPGSRLIVPLALLMLTSGCASVPFNAATESASLLRRDAEWAAAAASGKDIEKIVSYWSDDAVVIPQAQPVIEGKAAIREYVASSLKIPGFRIHWVSDNVSFSPDGKLAYMRGVNEVTVPGPTGQPMTLRGRALTVPA